jgi:cobalt-zinc-cadmium efflux system protein
MDVHEHGAGGDGHGSAAASLRAAILITLLIFGVEVAGGYVSGSLSLVSDAVHMLGDLFALLLSLAAVLLARQLPTRARTYGYHRAEVLAAFVNGLVLVAVTAGILYSAAGRLRSPPEIEAPIMLAVATVGLVANLVVIARLHGHAGLGVRSALLHVASDTLSSAAVVGAGVVIYATGLTVVDPVLSVLIAILVLASAVRLLRETTAILLQFTPRGLDLGAVTAAMREVDGVDAVPDVHVWALSTDLYVLDGHVVTDAGEMREVESIKTTIKNRLRRMGIDHVTLEFESIPCEGCVLDPDLVAEPDAGPGAPRSSK